MSTIVKKALLTDQETKMMQEYLFLKIDKGLTHRRVIHEMTLNRIKDVRTQYIIRFIEIENIIHGILVKIAKNYLDNLALKRL